MDNTERTKHSPTDTLQDRLDFIEQFVRGWRMLISHDVPNAQQCNLWARLHHPARMIVALGKVSAKAQKMDDAQNLFTADHQIKTFSSYCNGLKTDEENDKIRYEEKPTMDTLTAEQTAEEVLSTPQPTNYLPRLPLYEAEQKPKTAAIAEDANGILTPMTQENS